MKCLDFGLLPQWAKVLFETPRAWAMLTLSHEKNEVEALALNWFRFQA